MTVLSARGCDTVMDGGELLSPSPHRGGPSVVATAAQSSNIRKKSHKDHIKIRRKVV